MQIFRNLAKVFIAELVQLHLSAAPAKSDPLDFPSKKKFSFIFCP